MDTFYLWCIAVPRPWSVGTRGFGIDGPCTTGVAMWQAALPTLMCAAALIDAHSSLSLTLSLFQAARLSHGSYAISTQNRASLGCILPVCYSHSIYFVASTPKIDVAETTTSRENASRAPPVVYTRIRYSAYTRFGNAMIITVNIEMNE